MVDITNKIFHDEAAAVAHLEASRWSDGVACPLCNSDKVHRMGGKTQAGMFLCNGCREKFTARTGTVMERSHIPIHKWLFAMHLMAASKKGVSAKQIERTVGVSYKTAWFLMHRIREAMSAATVADTGPLGGEGKVVKSDETFVGGKAKNVHNGNDQTVRFLPWPRSLHCAVLNTKRSWSRQRCGPAVAVSAETEWNCRETSPALQVQRRACDSRRL
jgi:transposase-like protein